MKIDIPKHLYDELGAKVPKGGSSCANCKHLRPDMHCASEYFQEWNGSDKIPAKYADSYCSIWWEEREGRHTAKEALDEQRRGK